jgi:hypothetical protein
MPWRFRNIYYFTLVKGEGPVLNEASEWGEKNYGGNGGVGYTRSYPSTRKT